MRSAAIALVATLIALRLQPPATAYFNPQFAVVSTLREWHGSDGYFRFHSGARIVVDSADARTLNQTAEAFQQDLAALMGIRTENRSGPVPNAR